MKLRHYFVGMLAVAAAIVSCDPVDPEQPEKPEEKPVDPALAVSQTSLSAVAEASEATFTITTNQDWTATASETWVTLNPASGTASEQAVTVTVAIAANEAHEARTATITVTAAELTKTISVSQAGKEITEDGSEAKPWLIKTAADIVAMREKTAPGTTTYFRMEADVDMAGVTDYVPANYGDVAAEGSPATFTRQIHFDGNNKTISNFSCSYETYPSLFGVLYGSCKDLTVKNATITGTSACGILAGYAGTEATDAEGTVVASMEAVVTNVKVQGTVNGAAVGAGGMAGFARCATFTNCEAEVALTSTATDAGGFVGKCVGSKNTFTGCKVKATLVSKAASKNRIGGLIGWNSGAELTVTDCDILEGTTLTDDSGRTSASNGNYAGLIGYGDTKGSVVKISGCNVHAVIDAGDYATYNAGLVGCIGYENTTVEITDCSVAGSIKGSNYCAGLIAVHQNAASAICERCSSTMDIVSTGQRNGGLLGSVLAAITLKNCYSTGNLTQVGQQAAGLVGFMQGKLIINNCYATGNISSDTAGAAGLVGTINKGDGSEITGSIAWNKEIVCKRAALDKWAPGGIVGAANAAGKFAQCYRRADMVLTDLEGGMVLVDQDDIDGATPPAPAYSTTNTQFAYHGKAAAADATVSSVAKSLGWDESVWDLSGDLPKLK